MKKLFLIPIVLVTLPIILFIAAGTPFVLDFVRQKIEATVGDNLGIPMRIGSVSGNLFFVLRARDIEAQGLGRVDEIRIVYNPFGLLSRHVDIRSLRIDGIELDVDRLADVMSNLPRKTDSLPSKSSPLRIQIEKFSIANGGLSVSLGQTSLNVVLSSRGMVLHDRLIVDSLHIETKRSVAILKGVVPLVKAGDLDVAFDIDLAAEDLGVPALTGDLTSTGTIKGKFSSPMIAATTRVGARILENNVMGVIDVAWHLPHFDSLEVKGDLRLNTATLQKGMSGYDTWDAKVLLERTQVSAEVLSRYGNLQARGMLKGEVSRPQFEGAVSGRFDYRGFKPSFEGQVYYGDDILKFTHFKLASRRVTMALGARYNHRTKRITDTELSIYCNDLGVARSIIDAPEDISGELWLDVDVSGTIENPDVVARLRLSELVAFGEVVTSARLHASMKNNVARLDSGTIQSARGLIDLQGHYDLRREDFALQLNSDRLAFDAPGVFGTDTLLLGGTVRLDVVFSGDIRNPRGQGEIALIEVVYDTMPLGTYSLEFTLVDTTVRLSLANEQKSLTLAAEALLNSELPFNASAEIRHFVVDRFVSPAFGYVTAGMTARGYLSDLARTAIALRVDTVELTFENNRLHNIEPVVVDMEDGMIKLHAFTLGLAGQTIHLQGIMPVDFETAAMDISGKSSNILLSEIAYLLPGNPPISGDLKFDIRVQGKPRQLDIDGNLILDNGNYAIKDVLFDSVSGRFLFRNGLVTCETFSGKINNGRFEVNGFADVSHGRLDTALIKIDLKRIDFANKDFGRILVDADMRADGRRDSLRINGEITLVEGVYDAPMKLQKIVGLLTAANRPVPQQPEISRRIYCDIGITVPDSITVANNVANLSAKADLQLKGYLSRLNAYGTITSVGQGTIQYLGKKFNIVSAVIQFDDPYKLDPVIDLVATSTIAAADGDYEIYLVLNGTVSTWQLELSSSPPLPQQDIVSLLLIGQRRPGGVGSTVKDIDLKGKAKNYALDAVRYGIEKSGERLLGLDKFTVTGELDNPSSVRIGIEKSITKGFTFLYTTGIESWELHQVGASYDITDHISVFTLYDQENLNTSVDLDFHFKLK
ncbi:MAG: translocation/assembly module TamB domain-containing protein [candidate division WOR-3 bacterium]|nr:translocation/assembly module TamB domain-containing protein [candidate division WOR-3 bacterium]